MTPEEQRFLFVGAGLFVLGAIGFLTRRNLILMVLSAELMMHGVSMTLVTFGECIKPRKVRSSRFSH